MIDWTHKELADIVLKESAIVNGLWQNYATISGALIAFSVAAKDLPWWGRLGAAVAFGIFSWGNRRLIVHGARVQVAAIGEIVPANKDSKSQWPPTIHALHESVNTESNCNAYHYVIDAAVVLAIFFPALMPYRQG